MPCMPKTVETVTGRLPHLNPFLTQTQPATCLMPGHLAVTVGLVEPRFDLPIYMPTPRFGPDLLLCCHALPRHGHVYLPCAFPARYLAFTTPAHLCPCALPRLPRNRPALETLPNPSAGSGGKTALTAVPTPPLPPTHHTPAKTWNSQDLPVPSPDPPLCPCTCLPCLALPPAPVPLEQTYLGTQFGRHCQGLPAVPRLL